MKATVEERRELMVPANQEEDTKPILRTAHFLKPTATSSSDAQLPNPPPSSSPPSPLPALKLEFPNWRGPPRDWKRWVDLMEPEHSATWRKAGIFEAIKASAAAQVVKDPNLIIELARRWSPETNTFVFPWGEATVTLEDVMVTGGYSVSGSPVPGQSMTTELLEIENRLNQARSKLTRGKLKKACLSAWNKEFMSSGSEIEHEAFLALFLSGCATAFPRSCRVINPSSFRTAIQLARGSRISLAPVILANIYTDLSLLRNRIFRLARGGIEEDDSVSEKLILRAPVQLVQVWAWERFPGLRPRPNHIRHGEPRIMRWVKLKGPKLENLGSALDSSGRSFHWHLAAHSLYCEKEKWALVNDDSDEELKSFARCLIACELVGSDPKNVEQYHPHRVAMQFGLDQDLPGRISLSTFEKPIGDLRLYVPSHRSKPGVTARYLSWREKWKSGRKDANHGAVKFERSSESSKHSLGKWMEENNLCVPPGFKRKWNDLGSAGSSGEDELTIGEYLRSVRKEQGAVGNGNGLAVEGLESAEEDSGDRSEEGENNGEEAARESRKHSAAKLKVNELKDRISKVERVLEELKLTVSQRV